MITEDQEAIIEKAELSALESIVEVVTPWLREQPQEVQELFLKMATDQKLSVIETMAIREAVRSSPLKGFDFSPATLVPRRIKTNRAPSSSD